MIAVTNLLPAISISVLSFLATNLENLFILLAFVHNPRYSNRAISIGYISATGLILLASYGFSQVAQAMPTTSIHYLGFIPIFLGAWEFLNLIRKPKSDQSQTESNYGEAGARNRTLTVATATVSSGADKFIVFTSVFADTQYSANLVILSTAVGMGVLWVALARWLAERSWISAQLHRFGDFLLPLLLIAVGLFILMNTPVDVD